MSELEASGVHRLGGVDCSPPAFYVREKKLCCLINKKKEAQTCSSRLRSWMLNSCSSQFSTSFVSYLQVTAVRILPLQILQNETHCQASTVK